MIHLFEVKDYQWALFIGHIVIEKLLKAMVVKTTGEYAPFTHDLRRLVKLSKKEFQITQIGWLDTITSFNLNARYDSYKQAFYEKCTPEFTAEWISNIKELRLWIKQML
jgi:HEPN domain-containing protein